MKVTFGPCFTQVMQKLNSKNNAAGWVPSSGNRTAQAFSQPGKGAPVTVTPNVRLATSQIATPLHMQSQKNKMYDNLTFFIEHSMGEFESCSHF